MSDKTVFWIYMLIGVLLESAGDVLLILWAGNSKKFMLICGVLAYTLGTIAWAFSLKYEALAKSVMTFTVINTICAICIGIWMFNEDSSPACKAGIIVGILAVILMEF